MHAWGHVHDLKQAVWEHPADDGHPRSDLDLGSDLDDLVGR
jgi:hypothetical protein